MYYLVGEAPLMKKVVCLVVGVLMGVGYPHLAGLLSVEAAHRVEEKVTALKLMLVTVATGVGAVAFFWEYVKHYVEGLLRGKRSAGKQAAKSRTKGSGIRKRQRKRLYGRRGGGVRAASRKKGMRR